MAKNKLTQVAVKNAGDGKMFDGGGLTFIKKGDGGKWVYRYSHLGRRREMGLGSWPEVSLSEARKARDGWAAELAAGRDPLDLRNAARAKEVAERDRSDPTFSEMVDVVFEARRAGLRGDGARGRWRSPLDLHVIPKIGRKRMSDLAQGDVADALRPIWRKKHPTAQKALQRTRIVFREARLMGFDCDPFTVDAAERMLGEVRHVVQHIAATPWQDIPALYARLDKGLASHLCLRWMILTLVRSDGCRGALVSEVEGDVWTVPADRVKGTEGRVRDFRVPLSTPAMEIVSEARESGHEVLFSGHRGNPITDTAIEKALNTLREPGRPHGFRTSFRTWVQDHNACTFDVAETVLGHAVGSKVERSYARSDMLDQRRAVMARWADFVTGNAAKVIRLKG